MWIWASASNDFLVPAIGVDTAENGRSKGGSLPKEWAWPSRRTHAGCTGSIQLPGLCEDRLMENRLSRSSRALGHGCEASCALITEISWTNRYKPLIYIFIAKHTGIIFFSALLFSPNKKVAVSHLFKQKR